MITLLLRNITIFSIFGLMFILGTTKAIAQAKVEFKSNMDKEIEDTLNTYEKLDAEIDQLSLKHPTFQIMGEVRNVKGQSISLWGKSVLKSGPSSHWATSLDDTNIIVKLNVPFSGAKYYIGVHSFLEKITGKSAFGTQVPVLVYGNRNPNVAKQFRELEEQRSKALSKYNKLLLEVVQERIKKSPDNKVKVLIDFLQDGRYLSTALNELRLIGPTVSEELAITLMGLPEDSRLEAMKIIKGFGPKAKAALPYLIDLENLNSDKYDDTASLAFVILEESFPGWMKQPDPQNDSKITKPVLKEKNIAKTTHVQSLDPKPEKVKIPPVPPKVTDIDKIKKLLSASHDSMDIPAILAITSKSTDTCKNSAISLSIKTGLNAEDWRMPNIMMELLNKIDGKWFLSSGATTMIKEICGPLDSDVLDRNTVQYSLKLLGKIGLPARSAIPSILLFKCNQGVYDTDSDAALEGISPKWYTLPESESAVKELTEMVNGSDIITAMAAVELLEKIGPKAKNAVPSLVKLLKKSGASDFGDAIIKALGAIGPASKEALPTLKSLAKVYHRKTFIREAINSIQR
jgi:hypothetical protein